eukprot:gene17796-27411_t
MQCAICKSKLLYESLIGEYDVAADRGETRWELKGVDWLRRTKTHLQAGVVATCGQPCAGEWTRGAHAAPAVHTAAPDGQPCPPPLDGYVSMTTERYTVEQIEAVYRPVLVANIPEELPDALFRRILEHHGSVDAVVRDAGGGLALVVFSEGSAAERFFLTGHGMPLAPPELAARLPAPRAAAARRRLAVEFAMFLPEANRHLFDDLFGVKTTRQLLRAAPRRLSADGTPADPFPFTRAHCEALLFPAFRRHLRSSDAGPAVAADVALCRNWLLYKFNTGGGPREAAAPRWRWSTPLRASRSRGTRILVGIMQIVFSVHFVALGGMVAVIAILASNLVVVVASAGVKLFADGTPADPFPFTRAHREAL